MLCGALCEFSWGQIYHYVQFDPLTFSLLPSILGMSVLFVMPQGQRIRNMVDGIKMSLVSRGVPRVSPFLPIALDLTFNFRVKQVREQERCEMSRSFEWINCLHSLHSFNYIMIQGFEFECNHSSYLNVHQIFTLDPYRYSSVYKIFCEEYWGLQMVFIWEGLVI